MACVVTVAWCTFCGLGLALDANGKNQFQLNRDTSKSANTYTRTYISTHCVSFKQASEAWSVEWETHQSGSTFQCRVTSTGLVVIAAIRAASAVSELPKWVMFPSYSFNVHYTSGVHITIHKEQINSKTAALLYLRQIHLVSWPWMKSIMSLFKDEFFA